MSLFVFILILKIGNVHSRPSLGVFTNDTCTYLSLICYNLCGWSGDTTSACCFRCYTNSGEETIAWICTAEDCCNFMPHLHKAFC